MAPGIGAKIFTTQLTGNSFSKQKMDSSSSVLALICMILLQFTGEAIDPTHGFISLPLTSSNLKIQSPYNLGKNHKSHSRHSKTKPRSEIRIRGYDYSSGVWQFEGYGYVSSGTTGVSIMQVFGAKHGPTSLMMKVYHGSLVCYRETVVEHDIYNRWFRLNVIHDMEMSKLYIFIDGVEKIVVNAPGRASHFFKFGVYAQNHESHYMESQWKGIKVLKKM